MKLLKLLRGQPPLPDPPIGQRDYWVCLHVKLKEPLLSIEGLAPCEGYYRNIGLRVAPLELQQQLRRIASDGEIDWDETITMPLEECRLHFGVCRRSRLTSGDPSWYQSGRAFYCFESDEE